MKNISLLFSQYILGGVHMDETPFSALYDCLDGNGTAEIPEGPFQDIIDEYLDKDPASVCYDADKSEEYCSAILRKTFERSSVDTDFTVSWTIARIDRILLETIFRNGHFTIGDLMLRAKWKWDGSPAGNLAAFYDSTVTTAHYLFDLGLKLDRYFVEDSSKGCFMELEVCSDLPSGRRCPEKMLPSMQDCELIYIPFCQTSYQLGGSALSELAGKRSGIEPDLYDPDYFIDCYEVVRELTEDGIILAGAVVSRGGLMCAAERFSGTRGFSLDLSGIMGATGENDTVKLMFSEIPGVIVQVKDSDMDYLDSQFILQEIAYYPLGRC